MERTEVEMVVLIGLVVYLLGVDIHESAMEAFLARGGTAKYGLYRYVPL